MMMKMINNIRTCMELKNTELKITCTGGIYHFNQYADKEFIRYKSARENLATHHKIIYSLLKYFDII